MLFEAYFAIRTHFWTHFHDWCLGLYWGQIGSIDPKTIIFWALEYLQYILGNNSQDINHENGSKMNSARKIGLK